VTNFELGIRGRMATEVHYIAIRPSADTNSSDRLSIAHGINGFDGFPFKFKVNVCLVKPSLECLHNLGLQRVGGAWVVHGTGRDAHAR
jgi:hypothetical protein